MFESDTTLDLADCEPSSLPTLTGSLGRYRVRGLLGRGGEAGVYSAFDPDLARLVALKVYTGVDSPAEARLSRAVRLSGQLIHPNIVTTLDLVRKPGTWAIVQELLDGEDYSHASIESAEAELRFVSDVARAMAHAHSLGIAHLDLKPANVFRCVDGRTKVLDFGLARDFSAHSTIPLGGDALAGTPKYVAPEVYRDGVPMLESDVWSFGVLVFRVLTGADAFHGETFFQLANSICDGEIPSLDPALVHTTREIHLDAGALLSLREIVSSCLQRDARARPSFTQIAKALGSIS